MHSIEEAIGRLKNYPIFIKEIKEVCEYLLTNLEVKTFAVGEGLPLALEQYGVYTREEIFAIFGRQKQIRKCKAALQVYLILRN